MITEKVKRYIDEQSIYSDVMFPHWKEFLELLFAEGGCVKSIL